MRYGNRQGYRKNKDHFSQELPACHHHLWQQWPPCFTSPFKDFIVIVKAALPLFSPTPRPLWDFISCSHLFKAFEFHFILQLCIGRDLKFLIPSTSKTIAVKQGGEGETKIIKSSKLSIQLYLLHRKMQKKTHANLRCA